MDEGIDVEVVLGVVGPFVGLDVRKVAAE